MGKDLSPLILHPSLSSHYARFPSSFQVVFKRVFFPLSSLPLFHYIFAFPLFLSPYPHAPLTVNTLLETKQYFHREDNDALSRQSRLCLFIVYWLLMRSSREPNYIRALAFGGLNESGPCGRRRLGETEEKDDNTCLLTYTVRKYVCVSMHLCIQRRFICTSHTF